MDTSPLTGRLCEGSLMVAQAVDVLSLILRALVDTRLVPLGEQARFTQWDVPSPKFPI